LLYKCNYCDPKVKRGEKPIKSIDTDKDDFVKDEKGKYYHLDCYKLHLKKRKKKTDEEIEKLVAERLELQKNEMKEVESKERFYRWIMDYYNSDLPAYYCIKVNSIRKGNHEQVREPVDYDTLLDIYMHMANYLNKLAAKKQFKSIGSRMNYDLAVVIGNLGDYKRYKEKLKAQENEINEIHKRIADKNVVKKALIKKEESEEEFNILDIMDELLL
jgi:hypothetical protein